MKYCSKTLLFTYLIFTVCTADLISGDNFRIYPSPVTQTEPIVSISPVNPSIMFVSAVTINTSNGFKSEGVYSSTNGGLNWFGSDSCKGALISNHGGDPAAIIDKNGHFILNHIGSIFIGVYSHYSTDMGETWSGAYVLTNQQPEDKGTATTDGVPTSPYYGRSYASWVNFVSPFPVLVSYTTNSGVNWTNPLPINSPPPQRSSGGDIKTGPNGQVYVAWSGVTGGVPYYEDYAGFGISNNGGVNWQIDQNIFDMNGINGTLPSKGNIRVNGLPRIAVDLSNSSKRGWIYIVTTEKNISPAGSDPDIILHRSTNGGSTWSQGIRVNQDALNNGKIQYFPAISVDSSGAINILYYDDRNTTSDSAEVYLSRSLNGGNTWSDFNISDNRFKPKAIAGGPSSYQGDFISLASSGHNLFAYWMADYTGTYQIWTSIIDWRTIGLRKISTEVPKEFILKQNYPNPFNPSTNIEFSIPKSSQVKLVIYNSEGKEVASPVNAALAPGTYRTSFDGTSLASGVYFYRLITQDVAVSKKMILIK